eukprot:7604440-Karenia_brevis.AAC.1
MNCAKCVPMRRQKKRMYYGELCNIHGTDEADWMIESGKVEAEEDSDGDTIYVKKTKVQRDANCNIKTAIGARTSQ